MKTLNFKKLSGIGLIEVLITTVVVAVGLLAVGSLQGTLIGESRENKSRTEAKTLAESKIEELRDAIVKDNSGAFLPAAGTASDTVTGVTESFTRSWVVSDQTGPARKEIEVNICWSDGCPIATGEKSNQIAVQSEIVFVNVGKSAKNLKDALVGSGTTGSPSTNAESSDEITKIKDVADGAPDSLVSDSADSDGLFWIRQDSRTKAEGAYACSGLGLTSFESSLWTRRIDYDGVTGNEAIELFELQVIDTVEYCIPRIRYNGGVIIPIRGIVHSAVNVGQGQTVTYLDVDLFTFNASETGAYCIFNPPSEARSAPYVCYVGGNCTGFSGTTDDGDVTKCPDNSYAATKVGAGGWRGKVGLLGVSSSSNDFKNVCFSEEIAGVPAQGSLATARNYYSLRNSINEGLNKPYSCHDFLIIAGQSTERQIHDECVAQANEIGGLNLAVKNIARDITSGNNVFDPVIDVSYCTGQAGTTYTIIGTIENANSIPAVSINDAISTTQCSTTTTGYNCTITTAASSVTVTGVYSTETITCSITPVSSSGCTLTFTATTDPVYTVTGNISGTVDAANATTISISDGGSCVNNNDHNGANNTYSCSISTSVSPVTLAAVISTGGTVTPASETLILPGYTSPVTGPNFGAVMASTYTISGTFSLGVGVTLSETTVAVDPNKGGCNIVSGTNSYSCTVPAGANHLHITISPACTIGSGNSSGKQYEISDGSTTASGTGVLTIDLGTVSGSTTKNISIDKSSTNC